MIKGVLVFIITISYVNCFAADTIVVHKDSRLDVLTAKQAGINKSPLRLTPDGHYKGFRLLIITTNNRDEATKAKAIVLQSFPAMRAYLTYLSPYFKVKVGNFTNRQDAENFKTELARVYDGGIYLIEDIIEYEPPVQDTLHTGNQQ
jgi:hypothetical protein